MFVGVTSLALESVAFARRKCTAASSAHEHEHTVYASVTQQRTRSPIYITTFTRNNIIYAPARIVDTRNRTNVYMEARQPHPIHHRSILYIICTHVCIGTVCSAALVATHMRAQLLHVPPGIRSKTMIYSRFGNDIGGSFVVEDMQCTAVAATRDRHHLHTYRRYIHLRRYRRVGKPDRLCEIYI